MSSADISPPDGQTALEPKVDAAAAGVPAELDRVQSELKDANDRVLRVQAELENFRKRVRREMEDERKYAALPVLKDLLPVVDNLDRAVSAAEQSQNAAGLLDGVKMVGAQLAGLFSQHGCRRIAAAGAAFDPHLHEALAQEPSDTVPAGHVTRELQAGYQLHDRVIRPTQVFVSTGPANENPKSKI
jgi:molecular chaperone GrpE